MAEFALLSDGREVTLLDDRGWTSSAPLREISLFQVVRNVYSVVLPDDAEETGEEHEWQRFEQRLREAGVAVTPDELRALPYRILLSVPSGPAHYKFHRVDTAPLRIIAERWPIADER